MKTLVLILAASMLCSCTFADQLAETAMPIDKPALIAEQVAGALRKGDLNSDGVIQGNEEWMAFVLALYAAVREHLASGRQVIPARGAL